MKQHNALMQVIVGKIVDETFFGLACVVFTVSALWIFPTGFFKGCSICLALIFGVVFYIATIVRVSRKKVCRRYTKALWLSVVVLLPVIGGLLYYYLRLAAGYLQSAGAAEPAATVQPVATVQPATPVQ